MKKLNKALIVVVMAFMMLFCVNQKKSIADVGSFESYDSGDSGSSWSSSSSSSSSSWDSDYDSSGSYSGSSSSSDVIFWIVVGVIVAIILINKAVRKSKGGSQLANVVPTKSQDQIEQEVKAIDPNFNKEEFFAWARDIFMKLQDAWTKQDWSEIRVFESNQLFEQHKSQLQGYIDRNQKNILDRVCILGNSLTDFTQSGDKDILSIAIKSKMIDYIIDAKNGQILKGDTNTDRYATYKMTFTRKTGVKTIPGKVGVTTTNCPNCGAPTEITSAGKCKYCGSLLVTGDFGWVLTDYTRIS